MKFLLSLATLPLLAACAGASAETELPERQWLIGSWVLIDEGSPRTLIGCGSHLPIVYSADGTFSTWEQEGTWKLEKSRLTETATSANADAQPVDVEIGEAFVSRIERVGADEMRKTYHDGAQGTLLRCPELE